MKTLITLFTGITLIGCAGADHKSILKGFTVAEVYDERFSNAKGNAVLALDKVMVQALMRWGAKPGPMRRYLLELWNTSVGELWEIEWVAIISRLASLRQSVR